MGHTATICRIIRPPFVNRFSEISKKRTALYGVLKKYLEEDACVEGTPKTIAGINPYADMLGQYFLAILHSELSAHRGDGIESLASMKAMSIVFSEMWAEASEFLEVNKDLAKFDVALIPLGASRQRRLDVTRLEKVIEKLNGQRTIAVEHQFTFDFGNMLVKSYSKGLVELNLSAKGDDISIIKHHASLLGDLLDEMLDLVQYLQDDNPLSEQALSLNHPHHISS